MFILKIRIWVKLTLSIFNQDTLTEMHFLLLRSIYILFLGYCVCGSFTLNQKYVNIQNNS